MNPTRYFFLKVIDVGNKEHEKKTFLLNDYMTNFNFLPCLTSNSPLKIWQILIFFLIKKMLLLYPIKIRIHYFVEFQNLLQTKEKTFQIMNL